MSTISDLGAQLKVLEGLCGHLASLPATLSLIKKDNLAYLRSAPLTESVAEAEAFIEGHAHGCDDLTCPFWTLIDAVIAWRIMPIESFLRYSIQHLCTCYGAALVKRAQDLILEKADHEPHSIH